MNGMKRILILTLLSCVGLCTHVMAGEEKKGDRDEEEERSISHDPVKVEIANDGVMLHFMVSFDNVFIQVVDDYGVLIYEEVISVTSPQSYYIPMISSAENLRLFIKGSNIELGLPLVY